MDRRQEKTRNAIFQAFIRLLEEKHFNHITVQEILEEANVGRSTFYSHFETKDALLKALCTELFDHIFSGELSSEFSHDFSASEQDLPVRITHLLYHLRDNKGNLTGLLAGESGALFMRYFKEYLSLLFRQYPRSIPPDVPEDFALNHLVGSLAEGVKWWIKNQMKLPPEELAAYYMKLVGYEAECQDDGR